MNGAVDVGVAVRDGEGGTVCVGAEVEDGVVLGGGVGLCVPVATGDDSPGFDDAPRRDP